MNIHSRLPLTIIEQRVCDVASEYLAIPRGEVLPSSRLIEDLKCDSLDLVELIMKLEEVFAVTFPQVQPDSVIKAVFTRPQFRLSDLAELIHLLHGTGKPLPQSQQRRVIAQPPMNAMVLFSQLSGTWQPARYSDRQSLFEQVGGREWNQFRRLSDGMRCILLPSAEVEIGSKDAESQPDEHPVHRVTLDSFLIDAEPVATTAYCRFLNSVDADQQCLMDWLLLDSQDDRQQQMPVFRNKGEWQPVAGVEQLPMILVSWYGANAYSLWANGGRWAEYRTHEGDLPSEAQWEYAARGARSQPFPWGDASDSQVRMISRQHQPGVTYQADTLPMAAVNELLGMSPFGLHHMAGNVWQWCRDWYDEGYYRAAESTGRNPVNRNESGVRSERGGSWVGPDHLCRSSHRRGRVPNARGRCLGFRCVSDPHALPKSQ